MIVAFFQGAGTWKWGPFVSKVLCACYCFGLNVSSMWHHSMRLALVVCQLLYVLFLSLVNSLSSYNFEELVQSILGVKGPIISWNWTVLNNGLFYSPHQLRSCHRNTCCLRMFFLHSDKLQLTLVRLPVLLYVFLFHSRRFSHLFSPFLLFLSIVLSLLFSSFLFCFG